jgi:hypothetical protein
MITILFKDLNMRAISKVTSGELLLKQAMRKRMLIYTKNIYIFKLLLNIVTARIEALVSGNKFMSSATFLHVPLAPHYC